MNDELLSKLDQWTAAIEEKVAAQLRDMSDDKLAGIAAIIRKDPKRFVNMAPPHKYEFLALSAYLAIAGELTRRHETAEGATP